MMNSAFNATRLYNLFVVKETKLWCKAGLIDKDQLAAIHEHYQAPFYHPNFIIRILLFVATVLALFGITGLLALMIADTGEIAISTGCLLYGISSFVFLEVVFINNNHHYKSGVTEAVLYHACGFTIGGVAGLTDFNAHAMLWSGLFVLTFAGFRYLDLLCTLAAVGAFAGVLFFEFYSAGDAVQQLIPFVFMAAFSPLYFVAKKLKMNSNYREWYYNIIVVEALSLLFVYAAGNYFVVRELSTNLMELRVGSDEDIPLAFIFYILTVLIPVTYLYVGIKNKDIILLRVSLGVIAFSVFTFKYYYGFGHPEITLTIAGALLIGVSLWLLNYLKVIRHGFTRENHLAEKWGDLNVQAFIMSQTLGGNEVGAAPASFKGEGGSFGGGGASGDF